MAETITSPSNPAIKLARSLISRRRSRERERAFAVDGTRVLLSLIESGTHLRILFVDDDRRQEIDPETLDQLTDAADRVLLLESRLFSTVCDTEHPQPMAGIFEIPELEFPQSAQFILALDSVRDPGNLGTIVRTAAAAGVDGLALLPGSADPYNPKVVRASAGAIARLPVRSFTDLDALVDETFHDTPQIAVADASATIEHDRIDWSRPSLLIIGNEAVGSGPYAQQRADIVVKIPISSTVESLNAAIASAVIIFEAQRQRRRGFDEKRHVHANLY